MIFNSILLQAAEPGTLEKIISLACSLFLKLDSIVDTGVHVGIFMYFGAFANQFNNSPTILASARIIAFCIAVLSVVISIGGFVDAWEDFVKPIKIRPTLDGVQRESSSEQFWSLTWRGILTIGIVWIVAHLMPRLFLPIDDILRLMGR